MRSIPRLALVVPALIGLSLSACTSPPHAVDTVPLDPVAAEVPMTPIEPAEPVEVEAVVVEDPVVVDTAAAEKPAVEETPAVEDVAPQDDLVRLRLAKGDTFKYVNAAAMDMVITIEMMGMEIKTHTETTHDLSMVVLDQLDTGWNVRITFDDVRVKGTSENPMLPEPMEFDSTSDTPPADPQAAMMIEMLTATKGRQVEVTVGEDGRVTDVRGADALAPEGGGGGMGAMMGGGSGGMGEQQIGELFFALPDTAPSKGMSWKTDRSNDTGMMITNITTDHVIEALSDAVMTVAVTGAISIEIPEDTGDAPADQDMQAAMAREMMKTMKLESSSMTGTVDVSREDGMTDSRTNLLKMVMKMTNPGAGEMTMNMTTDTTLKRSK